MKLNSGMIFFVFLLVFPLRYSAEAATIYLMPTGNTLADVAVIRTLEADGNTVVVGAEAQQFNGTQTDLNGFDVVIILNSFNAASGSMPRGGTSALIKYVFNGLFV